MSDIQFLAIKEFEGKLRTVNGDLGVTGDLATLTANTGKDMYLANAKVILRKNTILTSNNDITSAVALSVNGVVKEKARWMWQTANVASGVFTFEYNFKNIGLKVTAGQIIKLDVTSLDAETDVSGFLACFEEDTGQTPQI